MEPNLDLLRPPKRFRLLPVLVIAAICAFGLWLMNLGSGAPPPRRAPAKPVPVQPAPAKAVPAGPLFVTVLPPQGWCCAERTKLAESSRTSCETAKGVFFEKEEEARAACRAGKPATAPPGSPRGRGRGA